jgi:hypothetical protein
MAWMWMMCRALLNQKVTWALMRMKTSNRIFFCKVIN